MDKGNVMQQLEALLADFNTKYSSSIEELTVNTVKMKVVCGRVRESLERLLHRLS